MKTNAFLRSTWLLMVFTIICIQIPAQNQSMMLPFSGINSNATQFEGNKIINFQVPNNSSMMELPKHLFSSGATNPADPHNENHLASADPLMIEKYLGQHPMFAQQVVHDKGGNLLFFIVDNDIYNRYGKANKLRKKNKLT